MNANTLRWIALSAGTAALSACGWFSGGDSDYEPRPSGWVPPTGGSNPPPDAGMDHGVMPPDAGVDQEEIPTSLLVIGSNFERGDGRGFDLLTNSFFGSAVSIHSDAVGRVFDGKWWIVNRSGRDSFQCYDPATNRACSEEIFVGSGSNPQDIIVKDGFAYVALYETGEVVKYDLASGLPVDWHDLTSFTWADGDRRPRPAALLLIGGLLVAALQDLPSDLANTANYNTVGKLVVIDTETGLPDSEPIRMTLRNPTALAYSEPDDIIYASCAGTYDTSDGTGGVQAIHFGERRMLRTMDDQVIGGTPGPLAVGAGYVFTTAGFSPPTVVRMSADLLGEGLEIFASNVSSNGTGWIPAIRWADDRLVIADRDPKTPGLYFSSADGSEQEGPYLPSNGLPPIDLYSY